MKVAASDRMPRLIERSVPRTKISTSPAIGSACHIRKRDVAQARVADDDRLSPISTGLCPGGSCSRWNRIGRSAIEKSCTSHTVPSEPRATRSAFARIVGKLATADAVLDAQRRKIELLDHQAVSRRAVQLLERHIEQHATVLVREVDAGERRRIVLDPQQPVDPDAGLRAEQVAPRPARIVSRDLQHAHERHLQLAGPRVAKAIDPRLRSLRAAIRDERSGAPVAHDQPALGELAQRLLHGAETHRQLRTQRAFRRNPLARLELTAVNGIGEGIEHAQILGPARRLARVSPQPPLEGMHRAVGHGAYIHESGYMCVVLKTILYSNYRSNDDRDRMRIRLLGTGTPTPSLKRMSSGYLVETAQRKVLFDFGPGAYHRMLEAGVRAVDITDVFFTHLHYDHCLDYVRLLMTRWDQGAGRIPELSVYGPAYTARMTEAIIGEKRTVRSRPRSAH